MRPIASPMASAGAAMSPATRGRYADRARPPQHRRRRRRRRRRTRPSRSTSRKRDGIRDEVVPARRDDEQTRADPAADVGPEHHVVGVAHVVAALDHLAPDHQQGDEEAEERHRPEARDGDVGDVEENRTHQAGRSRNAALIAGEQCGADGHRGQAHPLRDGQPEARPPDCGARTRPRSAPRRCTTYTGRTGCRAHAARALAPTAPAKMSR